MSPAIANPPGERPKIMATAQVPQRIPDSACFDCLSQLAARRGRPAVPGPVTFWLLAFVFAAIMLGTTLPTPLYVIYQAQWRFSSAIVTVTFAAYAAGVLAALLLAGRASDQAGRKPVLAAALGASACSWPPGRDGAARLPRPGRRDTGPGHPLAGRHRRPGRAARRTGPHRGARA